MWYVIQTETGRETRTKLRIEKTIPSDLYEEIRILYYETKRKYLGEWHTEKKRLFPGYLFIESNHIEDLYLAMKRVPELTKFLGYGDDIMPLRPEEERFLKSLTDHNSTAAMSYGIQVGDKIIVKEGVLMGKESIIRKVDRHKRKAFIEVEMLGQTRLIEIGLEIVEKR